MPPLIPRRRSRRRSWSGRAVMLLCGLIATVVLLGGVTQISRQSGPFNAGVQRSFARQGAVVVDASNLTAAAVRHMLTVMGTESRQALQEQLDTTVLQATDEETQADTLVSAEVPGGLSGPFRAAFSDRAQGVVALRGALDGLLGMHPLAVAGAPANPATDVATPTLTSASDAVNRMAAAGSLLTSSDGLYQGARRSLAHSSAHASLPVSRWVPDAGQWSIDSVTTVVDLAATSNSLAATHQLELRTVQLSPPALPSPNGVVTPNVMDLSPTNSISISVVLANLGSVDEPEATVQFSLIPQPGGVAVTKNQRIAVAAGGSVTLNDVTFSVKSGYSYQLSVAVVLPVDQTDLTNTSVTDTIDIAPGT